LNGSLVAFFSFLFSSVTNSRKCSKVSLIVDFMLELKDQTKLIKIGSIRQKPVILVIISPHLKALCGFEKHPKGLCQWLDILQNHHLA